MQVYTENTNSFDELPAPQINTLQTSPNIDSLTTDLISHDLTVPLTHNTTAPLTMNKMTTPLTPDNDSLLPHDTLTSGDTNLPHDNETNVNEVKDECCFDLIDLSDNSPPRMYDTTSEIFEHPDLTDIQFNTITNPESTIEATTLTNDSHATTNLNNSQPNLISFIEPLNFDQSKPYSTTATDNFEQSDIFEINFSTSKLDEKDKLPAPLKPSKNNAQGHSNNNIVSNSTQPINPNQASSLNSQFVNLDANSTNLSIPIHIYSIETLALVDTGACISTISAQFWNQKLRQLCSMEDAKHLKQINTVSGHSLNILGRVSLPCKIQDNLYDLVAYVVEGIQFDIILGRDFLSQYKTRIDFNRNTIIFEETEASPISN